jgi:ABC-type glutathione transport system ATPase component
MPMSLAVADITDSRPSGMNIDHILEVDGFSGGFISRTGDFTPVLKDASLALNRSALTAIVGETGSGKTLLALAILGVLPASFKRTSGSIRFNGTDLLTLDETALRRVRGSQISMVFQDARSALNPVFTVGSQISDVCRLHHDVTRKEADAMTQEMLERVRVPEAKSRMRQYPHEFSGGMAQRALLAMALICRPSLLLLDEPTTGLDVTIQADILDLIVEISREDGMSACMITHDLGIVAETYDYVIVMQDGEVCEVGTCEQIMTRPASAYAKELIAASRLEEPTS